MHVGAVLPDSTVIIIALGNMGKTSCPPIALISTRPYFLSNICNPHNSSCVTKTFWNFYTSRGQIFKCKSREIHFKDLPISLKIKEGIYRIIIWKHRFFVWQLFEPFSDPPCSSSCMLEHFESSKFSGKSSSAAWQKDGTAACQSALILSRAHQPDFPSNQCKRYYTNIGKYRSLASLNNNRIAYMSHIFNCIKKKRKYALTIS